MNKYYAPEPARIAKALAEANERLRKLPELLEAAERDDRA